MNRFKKWEAQSLFGGRLQQPLGPKLYIQPNYTMGRDLMGEIPQQSAWPPSEIRAQGVSPENNLGLIPRISESEIGNGLGGNIQTIKEMKKMARVRSGHPLLRKLALNILQEYQVPSHHFVSEALAIGDYVKAKVRYVRDPENIEYLLDPVDMVKAMQKGDAQGDCDDMALVVATLLLTIGHQPLFRAVRYDNLGGNYNHIYVVDYEKNPYGEKERIVIDCILKDKPIGSEVGHQNGEEYQI